jgi:hypothetical protein
VFRLFAGVADAAVTQAATPNTTYGIQVRNILPPNDKAHLCEMPPFPKPIVLPDRGTLASNLRAIGLVYCFAKTTQRLLAGISKTVGTSKP